MPIVVKEIDLEAGRNIFMEYISKYLNPEADANRYDWLYRKNPFGLATTWIAQDVETNAVVGISAAFPRKMRVQGKDHIAWNLGDFAIRPDQRSLGPALALQKACLAPVQDGSVPFFYDHPSEGMVAIYRRLGITSIYKVTRYAKPLRVDRKVGEFLKEGPVLRGVRGLGNLLLKLKDTRSDLDPGYEIEPLEGRFGEEFTALNSAVIERFKVCGDRTSDYLNWRYIENPTQTFETLVMRRRGKLHSYAVFSCSGEAATLADVFGEAEGNSMKALLSTVIQVCRNRKINTLSAPVIATSHLLPVLKDAGFFPREEGHVVFYARPKGELDGVVTDGGNWFLTDGDRDS